MGHGNALGQIVVLLMPLGEEIGQQLRIHRLILILELAEIEQEPITQHTQKRVAQTT